MATHITTIEPALPIPERIQSGITPTIFATSNNAEKRFWEFFAATIRNKNTRLAYLHAVFRFADWCEANRIELDDVDALIMSAYVEQLTQVYAAPTVKQHLAAIRMLFDWLVIGQIIATNPAAAVRGPKHVIKTGKTPVLTAEETRELIDCIDTSTLVGLRDRALVGVMIYSFARVTAAVSMKVSDYYTQGKRSFFRLHEKGGKYNVIPAHHIAQEYLDDYITAAAIEEDKKGPLFRSSGRGRQLDQLERIVMTRQTAIKMVKRRSLEAGLPDEICNHSFRGTGITEYLRNGGDLEIAAQIAGHESTRTTQLYNRLEEELSLDEIERIHI